MSKRILVAMSGSMDSAVAAALLKTQGFDVVGLHMQFWDRQTARRLPPGGSCCRWIDPDDVQKLCDSLEIPLKTMSVQEQYVGAVLDYVVHDYLGARVPNPCVLCNSAVKFDALIRKADELKCPFVATGHYAKVVHSAEGTETNLYKAADPARDQSYFLFTLTQEQLKRTIMPLGDLLESNVVKMARTFNIPTVSRGPGQTTCFVDNTAYRDLVVTRAPERYRPGGPIVDREGQALGRHNGLFNYRIGQHHPPGVEKPDAMDLFVIGVDNRLNALIIGEENELHQSSLVATDCNWIGVQDFTRGARVKARIRSRQPEDSPCIVTLLNNNSVLVEFDKPQLVIMPGQAIAFYQDDILVGGGWIEGLTTPITTKLSKRQAFVVQETGDKKKK